MFNFLTLILSVAIGSAMTAAGVYYGGSVLTSVGARAQSLTVVSGMQQIDAAWTLYVGDGKTVNTTVPTLSGGAAGSDFVVDGYLASVPNAPNTASTWGAGGAQPAAFALDLIAGTGSDSVETGSYIVLSTASGGTCLEIAKQSGAVASTVTALPASLQGIATAAALTTALGGRKFGCVQLAANPATLAMGGTSFIAGDGLKHLVMYLR